tara:strand:+ start:2644 stop:2766 length:123 start_codon:yes stop_codon:yes gene_type:complete
MGKKKFEVMVIPEIKSFKLDRYRWLISCNLSGSRSDKRKL